MNRIFSISNKKNNGLWFAARDVNEAVKLAIALGHVRNPANARTSDITDKSSIVRIRVTVIVKVRL